MTNNMTTETLSAVLGAENCYNGDIREVDGDSPVLLLDKYYVKGSELYDILYTHSCMVVEKAVAVAYRHPELGADRKFLYEAAMLHDIGIFLCDASGIYCTGKMPYICHGYLGADLLRKEGFPRHALVAERHTGTGLPVEYIKANALPLPEGRIYEPVSIEEQIICFADKFFSKTNPSKEKPVEKVEASLAKWSDASVSRFKQWLELFG